MHCKIKNTDVDVQNTFKGNVKISYLTQNTDLQSTKVTYLNRVGKQID